MSYDSLILLGFASQGDQCLSLCKWALAKRNLMWQWSLMVKMREEKDGGCVFFHAHARVIHAAIRICVIVGGIVTGQRERSRPKRAICGIHFCGVWVVSAIKVEMSFQKEAMTGQPHQIWKTLPVVIPPTVWWLGWKNIGKFIRHVVPFMKDFLKGFPIRYIFGEDSREFEGVVPNLGRKRDL